MRGYRPLLFALAFIAAIGGLAYWLHYSEEVLPKRREAQHEAEWQRISTQGREAQPGHEPQGGIRVAYFCYTFGSASEYDVPCFQGEDVCLADRRKMLETNQGVSVGDCKYSQSVYQFTFVCPSNVDSTCYQARDIAYRCERVRAKFVGQVNNLSECQAQP